MLPSPREGAPQQGQAESGHEEGGACQRNTRRHRYTSRGDPLEKTWHTGRPGDEASWLPAVLDSSPDGSRTFFKESPHSAAGKVCGTWSPESALALLLMSCVGSSLTLSSGSPARTTSVAEHVPPVGTRASSTAVLRHRRPGAWASDGRLALGMSFCRMNQTRPTRANPCLEIMGERELSALWPCSRTARATEQTCLPRPAFPGASQGQVAPKQTAPRGTGPEVRKESRNFASARRRLQAVIAALTETFFLTESLHLSFFGHLSSLAGGFKMSFIP